MTEGPPLRHRVLGAVVVALVAMGIVAPYVFPMTSVSTLSYDWVDADLFLWNFWWTKHALTTAHNPYWTDLLMYPSGASLAFHTFPLPYSVLTLPVQFLIDGIRGLAASFNSVVLLSSVTCGLGSYFLALRVTNNVPAAIIAGLVFVCTPYRALNMSRLHVLATEVLAWYGWAWIGFVRAPTRGRALAVGTWLAIAFYTSAEYALHAAGFSALWLLWMRRSRPADLTSSLGRHIARAAVTFLVLTLPLVVMQAGSVARGASVVRELDKVASWSPAVLSLFTPSRAHPLYGELVSAAGDYGTPGVTGMRSESSIAVTVWALVIVAAFRVRRDGSQFWFISTGAFLLMMLGPYLRLTGTITTGVPLPYAVLYWVVPPLHFARDPTRFFAITLLILSVVSAFGVRGLLERMSGRLASQLVAAAVGALVIFEGLTAWTPKVPASALISPAYDAVAAVPGEFAVLDLSPDQTALLAQTRHGRPITAGRVSNPRATAAATPLAIERDFQHAARTLALDPESLAARLSADREELDRLRLRFVIFPAGDPARIELAERLGLRVSTVGELVVCERS